MSKHRFLSGQEVRWKAPKVRIMLNRDDMISDHLSACKLKVYDVFQGEAQELPLFVPSNDQYPDAMRSMMHHDRPLIEMFPHTFSTREPWDPRSYEAVLLYDRVGKQLPFTWRVVDSMAHDHNEDHGAWVWLERGPDVERS